MSGKTHTALVLDGIGKPLKKVQIPTPEPQENELLLKVTACGLNPMDPRVRDYDFLKIADKFPAVIGYDIVGTIIATGPNSSHKVGSHVFAQGSARDHTRGGLQEYVIVDAKWAVSVPSNLTDVEASVFPINAFTSAASLFGENGLVIPFPGTKKDEGFDYKGTTLVIVGGGTNTGKFGIQYAKIAGIGKIIAVASLSSANELKNLGATHVVDRRAADVVAEVRKLVGDDLIYLYDTISFGLAFSSSAAMLSNSKKGKVVHIRRGGEVSEEVKNAKEAGYEYKNIFGSTTANLDIADIFWKTLGDWIENGKVIIPSKLNVIEGLDLDKVENAFQDLTNGTTRGKWAVKLY